LSETSFSSIDEAAAALSAASSAPEPAQAPAEPTPPGTSEPSVTPEGSQSSEGTTAVEADSFTRADLGTLLEGVTDPAARNAIETAYKSFQGDYTRSKQGLAEQAKAFEGLDPERARESLQFVEALETNPEFALRVHQELSSVLQQQGFTPAQAAQAATNALDDSLGAEDDDEPVSALAKEVSELRQWKDQFENSQREQQLAAQIHGQELAIRQANPDLDDDDISDIYAMAWAHGGDLTKAHAAFKASDERRMARYISQKSEVPPAAPPVTGHAEAPTEAPKTMADADRLAQEYLDRALANS
jgi:hypothetical protein